MLFISVINIFYSISGTSSSRSRSPLQQHTKSNSSTAVAAEVAAAEVPFNTRSDNNTPRVTTAHQ